MKALQLFLHFKDSVFQVVISDRGRHNGELCIMREYVQLREPDSIDSIYSSVLSGGGYLGQS